MDPRVPHGIQEISADLVSEKPAVRIDELDRMPGAMNPNIPSALQGIDDNALSREKGYLETAKDTLFGTYETVKDKASDVVNSSYAQKASEHVKGVGNAVQQKFDEPDVRVQQLDQMPNPTDPRIPGTLQGTDEHYALPEKGLLEAVKEKIGGTYDAVKEKASDLVYGHPKTIGEQINDMSQTAKDKYESASEQAKDMSQTAKEKYNDMSEASREYISATGGKMKSAGEYLQAKSHNKNACNNTAETIKKYAEISADKIGDLCEASREYMDTTGEKMKDAGNYLQKKSD